MTESPFPSHAPITASPSAMPDGEVLRAWLRVANLQFTPRLTTALLAHFDNDPLAIFAARDAELDEVPGFQSRHLVRLRDPDLLVTDRQWAWVEKQGVWLALLHRPEYPRPLRDIPDPPPILFVRGTLVEEDRFAVGIVGSRHATPYGRTASERLARELAGHGLTVVSGGAVGIDTSAHRGALEGGGRTIAFLGCGPDVDYPRENRLLFDRIVNQGALISEYPLGAQPESWRFPMRNRLISGMALGIVVVEAPIQSGALITARYAAEQGRQVMTVPGNIDRPSSAGSNELLKDGASPITETADILRALGMIAVPARPQVQFAFDMEAEQELEPSDSDSDSSETTNAQTPSGASSPRPRSSTLSLPESQRKILEYLTHTPQHIDALAQRVDMSASETGVELTLLELQGMVRRLPGNTYIRVLA